MEHLAGDASTMVHLKEQGCIFEFEFREVYWNSRLQGEHKRLIETLFFQSDSTTVAGRRPIIADATCGIGPFSIPAVKNGYQLVSHANDLNPKSIHWLRNSAHANKLPSILEVQDLPDFDTNFDAPEKGSKLVIHAPGDAGAFIGKLCERHHPVTHAIFNLPATGVEMLDCFRGLKYAHHRLPRPLVACYTFSDAAADEAGPDGCVADLLRRLSAALGVEMSQLRFARAEAAHPESALPLPSPQVEEMLQAVDSPGEGTAVAIRFVRNVSPTKNMFCVCFRVPEACCAADHSPPDKRVRLL